MNWGYKILSVYIVFIAGILFLVFKSSTQNQDLVVQDYYEQELQYQQRIDETERANALSAAVKYEIINDEMIIHFPEEMKGIELNAKILLYCPSDKNKDLRRDISTNNALLKMAVPLVNKGLHVLKINWKANEMNYYFEHKIFIQ